MDREDQVLVLGDRFKLVFQLPGEGSVCELIGRIIYQFPQYVGIRLGVRFELGGTEVKCYQVSIDRYVMRLQWRSLKLV